MVLVMGGGRLRRWTGMGGQAATTALTGPLALRGAGCPWWGTGGVRQNPDSGDGADGGIGAWRRSMSRQRPKGWEGRQEYRTIWPATPLRASAQSRKSKAPARRLFCPQVAFLILLLSPAYQHDMA
jgi:hypothetical protein